MRVHVYGAGPAGCTVAHLLAKAFPSVDIRLFDSALDTRPGAGIVLAKRFYEEFRSEHPELLDLPAEDMASWDTTLTRVGHFELASPAHGTVAVSRAALVAKLRSTASSHDNVTMVAGDSAHWRSLSADADLVVAADGATSSLRRDLPYEHEPAEHGRTAFLWASVGRVLPAMFDVRMSPHGMILLHVYPHSAGESTIVVEALPETLHNLGLWELSGERCVAALATVLADSLHGGQLGSSMNSWRRFVAHAPPRFVHVSRNEPPVALLGDAAQCVHYSVGLGTTLALSSAAALVEALRGHPNVAEALSSYERLRRPVIQDVLKEAESSRTWFEEFITNNHVNGAQSVLAIRSRRANNTFDTLARMDPQFAREVIRAMDGAPGVASGESVVSPSQVPLVIGPLRFETRALSPDYFLSAVGGDGPRRSTTCLRAAWVEEGDGGTSENSGAAPTNIDLLLVPAGENGTRMDRSRLAHRARITWGLPVLYVHQDEPPTELDTLIAAGRIDLSVNSMALDEALPNWRGHVDARIRVPKGLD